MFTEMLTLATAHLHVAAIDVTPDDLRMLCRALAAGGAVAAAACTDRRELARRARAVALHVIGPAAPDVHRPLGLDGDGEAAREVGDD